MPCKEIGSSNYGTQNCIGCIALQQSVSESYSCRSSRSDEIQCHSTGTNMQGAGLSSTSLSCVKLNKAVSASIQSGDHC